MSKLKPLFFKQETRYSCAPACLRMVLSAFGVHVDETKLRQLSDCSPLGTDAFQLVEAARRLGFTATRKHTLASVEDLMRFLDQRSFPIVYVDLWPLRGGLSGQYHSLVVEAIEQQSVLVLDPLEGEREIPIEDFQTAWEEMRRLAIVVER